MQVEQRSLSMIQINEKLKIFKTLTVQQRQQVKTGVKKYVKKIKAEFLKRLQANKAKLTNLNLILGITGAGKSTLFNFLNGIKLIKMEGKDKNGNNNGEIRIGLLDKDLNQIQFASPIGHGFVSQTAIPQFHYHEQTETTYVDCAGEFDNKDVLQSIINSYLKYQIAQKAKRVKLTIVVNRNDIYNNRGTCFKKVLEQVSNFIGLWKQFQDSENISFVISNVESKNSVQQIKNALIQMTEEVADLGVFKKIIQNVVRQNSIAVFLKPSKKVSNLQYLIDNDLDQSHAQYQNIQGKLYDPNPRICSPVLITEALGRAKFMEVKEGLFLHNLQPSAQLIVNQVTKQIIEEIKKEILFLVLQKCTHFNQPQGQKLKAAKKEIEAKMKKLQQNSSVEQIIETFEIQQQKLMKLCLLRIDLGQFMTISNIADIQGEILKISIQIINDLLKMLQNFDEKMLKQAQRQNQQTIKRWNADKVTYERQINELRQQRNKRPNWWQRLLSLF